MQTLLWVLTVSGTKKENKSAELWKKLIIGKKTSIILAMWNWSQHRDRKCQTLASTGVTEICANTHSFVDSWCVRVLSTYHVSFLHIVWGQKISAGTSNLKRQNKHVSCCCPYSLWCLFVVKFTKKGQQMRRYSGAAAWRNWGTGRLAAFWW